MPGRAAGGMAEAGAQPEALHGIAARVVGAATVSGYSIATNCSGVSGSAGRALLARMRRTPGAPRVSAQRVTIPLAANPIPFCARFDNISP